MKSLFILCLAVAASGCSAEIIATDKEHTANDSAEYSLPPRGVDHGFPCPSPLVFTVVINGKEEVKVMHFPCTAPMPKLSPASDPPGWGTDDQSNHYNNIPWHEPQHDPVVDPVPHKF